MEKSSKIRSDETAFTGSWQTVNGQMVEDEICRRIRSLIETELRYVATSGDGWAKLYQDPSDGRHWELTYPRGEMQGGGPQALIVLDSDCAREKYRLTELPRD